MNVKNLEFLKDGRKYIRKPAIQDPRSLRLQDAKAVPGHRKERKTR